MLVQREEVLVEVTGVMKKMIWQDKQVLTMLNLRLTTQRRRHRPLTPQPVLQLSKKVQPLKEVVVVVEVVAETLEVEMDQRHLLKRTTACLMMIILRRRLLKMLN